MLSPKQFILFFFFFPSIFLNLSTSSCHLILTVLSFYSEIFSCFSLQFSTSYSYARSTKSSTVISAHVDFSLLKTSGVIFNCFTYVRFFFFFFFFNLKVKCSYFYLRQFPILNTFTFFFPHLQPISWKMLQRFKCLIFSKASHILNLAQVLHPGLTSINEISFILRTPENWIRHSD